MGANGTDPGSLRTHNNMAVVPAFPLLYPALLKNGRRLHIPQIFLCVELREFAGALHILSLFLSADGRDLCGHLLPREMTAHPGLGALADLDLNGIRDAQVFIRHAVFVGNILKYVLARRLLFLRQNASFPAAQAVFAIAEPFASAILTSFDNAPKDIWEISMGLSSTMGFRARLPMTVRVSTGFESFREGGLILLSH